MSSGTPAAILVRDITPFQHRSLTKLARTNRRSLNAEVLFAIDAWISAPKDEAEAEGEVA